MGLNYRAEELVITLSIFLIIILFFVVLAFYLNRVKPFVEKRRYYKMEMSRSDGREYRFWKRKLKKLYMRSIPIIGRFFR